MKYTYHKGLTHDEALKLQTQFGKNEIITHKVSALVRFLKRFVSPIPLMIEIALVLSAISGRWEDFLIIFVLLSVNIFVDFYQEHKAFKALAVLTESLAPTATVLRDGKLIDINACDLVPGDIVKLKIGDIAPADLIIIDKSYLQVDQSAITGESLPASMKKGSTIPSGAIIQKGSTYTRVTATGSHTSIGESASLVARAEREEKSHFQTAILKIGQFLIVLSLLLIVVTFTALILRGDSIMETVQFALVLTIASIPVALPAVLSVTMAIGANVLAKKNTIVSNFKAIEELAGVDQLCIDKTGTLTDNHIEVFTPKLYNGFNEKTLFTYAQLASEEKSGSPIEEAIFSYALQNGYILNTELYRVEEFIPFDPEEKKTEVSFYDDKTLVKVFMGASQMLRHMLSDKDSISKLKKDVEFFAKDGFRTIALAKKIKDSVVLVGLIPLMDPPRSDSRVVIKNIQERGIVVKMLTGDNISIATYVAKQLGIGNHIVSEPVLQHIEKTKTIDDDISVISKTDVFTEVKPADKYHIVETLQKVGHIVAMTGDGVNDAPALKKADVGIAVSGATPAARAASDIVLLDKGLNIIKEAIDQARKTFARMQAYATFRIAETIRIVFFITFSVLVFNYSPLTAVMIILLALLNDIPVLAIAYDNVPMSDTPVRWHLRETIIVASILGMMGLISSFGLFYYLNAIGVSIALIQTILFLKLDVAGHSTLYLTRAGRKHFWSRPFPSLKFFLPAFSSRIIGTIIVFFGIFMQAIDWHTIIYIWIYATIWFLINDQVKVFTYKILDKFFLKK